MKIDWFYFIMGISWIIVGMYFLFLDKNLKIAIVMFSFVFGILYLLKPYFQGRGSIWRLFKK